MSSTLIGVRDFARHLDDARWLAIDCRFELTSPRSGEPAYRAAHIPGAIYAHLDRDLAAPVGASTGRHPLPDPDHFATTLGTWGMTPDTQVVAYDAGNSAFAARLWWLLRWVGHRKVAVLDGGFKAWLDAKLPVTSEIPARAPTCFIARPDRNLWVDSSEVAQKLHEGWRLLDARAPERFIGAVEPLDPVAGHIPGAVNHPLTSNLGRDEKFLPQEELRGHYAQSQRGVSDEHTIAMCGSGVTACHLLLAMEVAGKPGAKLYAGSWSEWIRDPTRPIAKG